MCNTVHTCTTFIIIIQRYRQIPGDVCVATEDNYFNDYFNTKQMLPCPNKGN